MCQALAPLWKRLLSIIYDLLILAAVSIAYFAFATAVNSIVFGQIPSNYRPNASGIWVQLGWVLTLLGFYCYFWMKVGQTVAMKAWRIKVVADNNRPLTLSTCVLRCIVGVLSFACCGLGYFWMWVDKDGKALHDRISKTSVILLDQ